MVLSAGVIRSRLGEDSGRGDLVITPFDDACLQPASYDLRISEETLLIRGQCTLVPTLEWVELPSDIAATLRGRSSYGRRGLLLGAGYVDPGFRGQLTLCCTNMGTEDILLAPHTRLVQMILHEVTGGGDLYNGRYQDSRGVVHARD
ncbi:deoxycytidine triphosphate deaminase [Methanocalculus chunghsingensis]|uniref:Deoxycytidine triphosphate deaminase n=1 Tax=Methanocalculus chunghsingensis TaxID=156457 RepID=A0A8J7W6M2_9EURY|nr:dCTP deaminase [Methanocalculus chunghsingensis]MBR1369299.1 deoxycytidine triphosphate deaminase [Methanocalculus chunghsingensis]